MITKSVQDDSVSQRILLNYDFLNLYRPTHFRKLELFTLARM